MSVQCNQDWSGLCLDSGVPASLVHAINRNGGRGIGLGGEVGGGEEEGG